MNKKILLLTLIATTIVTKSYCAQATSPISPEVAKSVAEFNFSLLVEEYAAMLESITAKGISIPKKLSQEFIEANIKNKQISDAEIILKDTIKALDYLNRPLMHRSSSTPAQSTVPATTIHRSQSEEAASVRLQLESPTSSPEQSPLMFTDRKNTQERKVFTSTPAKTKSPVKIQLSACFEEEDEEQQEYVKPATCAELRAQALDLLQELTPMADPDRTTKITEFKKNIDNATHTKKHLSATIEKLTKELKTHLEKHSSGENQRCIETINSQIEACLLQIDDANNDIIVMQASLRQLINDEARLKSVLYEIDFSNKMKAEALLTKKTLRTIPESSARIILQAYITETKTTLLEKRASAEDVSRSLNVSPSCPPTIRCASAPIFPNSILRSRKSTPSLTPPQQPEEMMSLSSRFTSPTSPKKSPVVFTDGRNTQGNAVSTLPIMPLTKIKEFEKEEFETL